MSVTQRVGMETGSAGAVAALFTERGLFAQFEVNDGQSVTV